MNAPDLDVASIVASYAGLELGADVFSGPLREATPEQAGVPFAVQPQAVFCLATGGPPPQAYLGENRWIVTSVVQVMVRSNDNDFEGGQELARKCRDSLNFKPPPGYVEAVVREPEPTYLGPDASDRHLWSMNVELTHVRSA